MNSQARSNDSVTVMEIGDYTGDYIPPEICNHILSYLPVKSLLRFRSVSKDWKSIIHNPDFASLNLSRCSNNHVEPHLIVLEEQQRPYIRTVARARWFSRCSVTPYYQQTSEFDFTVRAEPVFRGKPFLFISGDVDGLLLVERTRGRVNHGDVFLWNPSIRKCLSIPFPPHLLAEYMDICLGFDPSTNDYKVICLIYDKNIYSTDVEVLSLEVFSLKSRTWRKGSFSRSGYEVNLHYLRDDNKVSLGGVLYWIGINGGNNGWCDPKVLISLNMTSETLSFTPLPTVSNEHDRKFPVVVAGSSVGILSSGHDNADIWVLGKNECWSKKFRINTGFKFISLSRLYLNKYNVLIWEEYSVERTSKICALDINAGKKIVVSQCGKWRPFYLGVYIQSLLLLS